MAGDCAYCNQKGKLLDALADNPGTNNDIHMHSCDNTECGLVYEVNVITGEFLRITTPSSFV